MPTSLSWRQRGRLSTRPGGGMLLKTGGGKFLKNSAATGGMIQKNDSHAPAAAVHDPRGALQRAGIALLRVDPAENLGQRLGDDLGYPTSPTPSPSDTAPSAPARQRRSRGAGNSMSRRRA